MYMMELQLGLALPSNSIKEFDLNCFVYEPKEVVGSNLFNRTMLQLGPCFSSKNTTDISSSNNNNNKKRSFDEAFEHNIAVPRTLPLLLWNNQPPGDDDDPEDLDNSFAINNKNDGDGDGVVGWPPVKSWRKKQGHQNNRTVENACAGYGVGASNSMFVKVKMEGVAIGRKIDLSLHHSFQTLKHTLINMFGKCREDSNCYKLTYQDSEGDWLLAEDLPWRTFIRSVHRLKLLRSNT